ncbi:MAG: outer membrane protein assembly factor BamD [Acidobacteriota bacterium]|nr:outer membrane protein assembly factor BamD [Acidobacteriota bacterium]
MKRNLLVLAIIIFGFSAVGNSVFAQKQIEPQIQRDPILETDASHNLEVANQYFKTKKAYKAVLMRFEETFAAYPDFSKMDEFLYLAGMSSYYLSENKGKQKIDTKSEDEKKKFAPEKLREDATAYLAQLVEKYPQSQYKTEAEKTLKTLEAKK